MKSTMRLPILAGVTGAAFIAGSTGGQFTGVTFELIDAGAPDGTTFRIYANFDDPADQLLAVFADYDLSRIYIATDTVIMNDPDSPFAGWKQEDLATAPHGAAWDSYVTIGDTVLEGNETDYSPGFLGSEGMYSVIHGSVLSQPDNGGWFDQGPDGTPVTPDVQGRIIIAQITVADTPAGDAGTITMEGVIACLPGGTEPMEFTSFDLLAEQHAADVDGDGAIGYGDLVEVLSNWGDCPPAPEGCPQDVDEDGTVGYGDLIAVLSNWS